MILKSLLVLGACGILLTACGEVENAELNPRYPLDEFYPLGQYEWIYKADSVIYDLVGGEQIKDSTSSYIRFRMDRANDEWFLVESERRDTSSTWKVTETSQLRVDQGDVVLNRKGLSLILLKLPLGKGVNWEETALADPDFTVLVAGERIAPFSIPWKAEYVDVLEELTVGEKTYSQVMHKISIDEDVLIERRLCEEWYARGVGLVKARGFIADTQCEHLSGELADCIDVKWSEKATRGFQYLLTLESFDRW